MAERGGVKQSPLESGRAMVECSGVRQIPLEATVEWETGTEIRTEGQGQGERERDR